MIFDVRSYGGTPSPTGRNNNGDPIDQSNAISAALQAANVNGQVFIPPGVWYVSKELNFTARWVRGCNFYRANGLTNALTAGATIIRAMPGTNLRAVASVMSSAARIQGLIFDAAGIADHGFYAMSMHGNPTYIENINALGAKKAGFHFQACQVARLDGLLAQANLGSGFVLVDCNATRLLSPQALLNEGSGIVVIGDKASGGVRIRDLDCELNKGPAALDVSNTKASFQVDSGYIEHAVGDGILLNKVRYAVLRGLRVTGVGSGNAFHLKDTSDTLLDACGAAPGPNTSALPTPESYASIKRTGICNANVFRDCVRYYSVELHGPLPVS